MGTSAMAMLAGYDDSTKALQGSQKLGLSVHVIRKVIGPNPVQATNPHVQCYYVYCGKYEVYATAEYSSATVVTSYTVRFRSLGLTALTGITPCLYARFDAFRKCNICIISSHQD